MLSSLSLFGSNYYFALASSYRSRFDRYAVYIKCWFIVSNKPSFYATLGVCVTAGIDRQDILPGHISSLAVFRQILPAWGLRSLENKILVTKRLTRV